MFCKKKMKKSQKDEKKSKKHCQLKLKMSQKK